MVALFDRMPPPLAATVMVQEQLALALNRLGEGERAESVLLELLDRRGPSSETYGILGRVSKDRWRRDAEHGELAARGLLKRAIDAYLRGFETDWRDAYPGINALSLMEVQDPTDPRREILFPVVGYAVERRIRSGQADYWDDATGLELAVLRGDQEAAMHALADAAAALRERWEAHSTAANLRLIRQARQARGVALPWQEEIEAELERLGRPFTADPASADSS
jgi:hypothetical protein